MKEETLKKHISKLIRNEVSYFNGWSVPEETMNKDCDVAAYKVYRYLETRLIKTICNKP